MTTHYETLGVPKTATPDEIKKAYRKLAAIHHPDKETGNTAKFQEIQSAYENLGDPQKRQQYDNPQPQGFHFQSGSMPPGMDEMFSAFFGGRPRGPQQHHTPSYRTQVSISLEQAFNGGSLPLRLQTQKGVTMVNVTIPRGIQHGGQMRFEKVVEGMDLLAEFIISPHLKYERHGHDLVCAVPISVLALIVGTTTTFETLSGKTLEVTIPPKTQPFFQMRLGGHGMPVMNSSAFGDQILVLKPFVPDGIPESLLQSIRQYQTNCI